MSQGSQPDESIPGSALARRWRALDRGWQATLLGFGIVAATALADALAVTPL
jgi:hypothetical protein